MNKSTLSIIMLYASLRPLSVYAQEAARQTVSIEEMFLLADQDSESSCPCATGIDEAHEDAKAAKNARLPEIEASLSFSYLGDALLTDRNFSNGSNASMPHYGNNFTIEATQVVYAGEAITNSIAIARLQEEMARLNLDTSHDKVRFLLIGYYLDLFKQQDMLQVYEKNIEQTKQVIGKLHAKKAEEVVLKNDITRYELLLANLELARIQIGNTTSILNDNLTTSLGLPEDISIQPDTTILSEASPIEAKANWTTIAYANFPVLRQMSLAVQISKHQQEITRSERIPKVALFAGSKPDGPITIEVFPINKNLNYWCVGVGLKYNFSSLFRADKAVTRDKFVIRRSIEQCEDAREQTGLIVSAGQVKYLETYAELNTQWESAELANLNCSVARDRYKNDMVLITDMLDASSSKLTAEMQLVNTQINVVFNCYKLLYVSGTV